MNTLVKRGTFPGLAAIFIAFIYISGCQPMKSDPSQEMKPIADKYLDVWNTGNLDELNSIIDSSFVYMQNAEPQVMGLDGIKKEITQIRTAFPDLKITSENLIYGENGWAVRWKLTGTNTGPGENPPTGKSVSVWGESIFQVANGKLTKEFAVYDSQSFMQQLGFTLMPPSEKKK